MEKHLLESLIQLWRAFQIMDNFTVLMSVYKNEKPEYLTETFESLIKSSIQPNEIILVEDGPLTEELYEVVSHYSGTIEYLRVIVLKKNVGLSKALNSGLAQVKTEFIARMDTDDVVYSNRFSEQLRILRGNSRAIVVGSNIDEFSTSPTNIDKVKTMPEGGKQLVQYAKRRNPLNHPSVMFRTKEIVDVGGYSEMHYFEDYYLWLEVLDKYGHDSIININDSLMAMRANSEMYLRRGGVSYCKDILRFRNSVLKKGYISIFDYLIYTPITCIVALLPNRLRGILYKEALRKNQKDD